MRAQIFLDLTLAIGGNILGVYHLSFRGVSKTTNENVEMDRGSERFMPLSIVYIVGDGNDCLLSVSSSLFDWRGT